MKKHLKLAIAGALLFAGSNLFAKEVKLSQGELQSVTQKLKIFDKNGIELKVVDGIQKDNLEILKIKVYQRGIPRQTVVAYKYKNSDALIFGKAIDLKTGKEISLPKNMNIVKEGVAFKIGHGPKKLYLVTDPECPFCRRMEKNLPKNFEDKYTVNVIPMPLSFHKHAKQMYYYILAGKNNQEKAKRMKDVMTGKDLNWQNYKPSQKELEKYNKIIRNGYKAARELGARGTPSVFDEKGNPINYMELLKK